MITYTRTSTTTVCGQTQKPTKTYMLSNHVGKQHAKDKHCTDILSKHLSRYQIKSAYRCVNWQFIKKKSPNVCTWTDINIRTGVCWFLVYIWKRAFIHP